MSDVPEYPVPNRSVPAVAFDLDGTLATDTWPAPHIGQPIPEGVEALLHYWQEGFAIYIYTARPESHKWAITRWLAEQNLAHVVYDIRCDKPIADLYVDDRAWRPTWAQTPGVKQARPKPGDDAYEPEPEPDQEPFEAGDWTVVG